MPLTPPWQEGARASQEGAVSQPLLLAAGPTRPEAAHGSDATRRATARHASRTDHARNERRRHDEDDIGGGERGPGLLDVAALGGIAAGTSAAHEIATRSVTG
jgi:hypothetical protein